MDRREPARAAAGAVRRRFFPWLRSETYKSYLVLPKLAYTILSVSNYDQAQEPGECRASKRNLHVNTVKMVNNIIHPAIDRISWQTRLPTIALLILLLSSPVLVQAKLACTSTEFCEKTLRPGSKCVKGYCDNPFQYGCLQSQKKGFTKLRVCHSEDDKDAALRGLCRDASAMNYPEIRILSQNWESPFFEVSIPTLMKRADCDTSSCLSWLLTNIDSKLPCLLLNCEGLGSPNFTERGP